MDIYMTTALDTKVDAINATLDAIGEVGINSEEEIDWNIDAASADKLVDRMSQTIQTNQGKGFWFNREEFHKFTPDPVNGTVTVPNNTLACFIKRRQGEVLQVTLRNNILFDTKEMGYDMSGVVSSDGKVHCILVVNLPFEALPSTCKIAITDACRFWFVNDKEGDQVKLQALKMAADGSIIALQAEDSSQKKRNMFNNPLAKSAIGWINGTSNVRSW